MIHIAKCEPDGKLAKALGSLLKFITYKDWQSQVCDEMLCYFQIFLCVLQLQNNNNIQVSKVGGGANAPFSPF